MLGVTIVIPAYNEEKFLPATLATVNAARAFFEAETKLPTETIVVNNLSTDETEKVAISLGATVVLHKVRNIASVRNAGIKAAKHKLIVAIDADCFLPEDALTKIWDFMSDGLHVGGALGVKVVTDKLFTKIAAPIVQAMVARFSGIYGAMFFFLREEALAIGGFPEKLLVAEDTGFALALRKHALAKGKKFGLLRSVQVGTLDRKDVDMKTVLPAAVQVLRAFAGSKQTPDDLGYWYKPKR